MALSLERLTKFAGVTPSRGTFPIKANTRIFKGSMVAVDTDGRAMPAGIISGGALAAVGKASATYDNRTGSDLGGGAGACNVEVEFGVFAWLSATGGGDDIDSTNVGAVCFMKDDQTVALTNNTDTRGIAGFITEVRGDDVYVYMGPHVAGLIVIASSEASQLDTAQVDIDAVEARALALEVDATTIQAQVNLPLGSFFTGTGTPLVAFNAGVSDGLSLEGSKCAGFRWNDDTTTKIFTSVVMPQDYDDTANVVVHFLGAKIGATAGDTPAMVTEVFSHPVGDAYDLDADFGSSSGVFTNAGTKVVQEKTLILTGANVPASPVAFTLSIIPDDLATDDFLLIAVWLEYKRKQMTS